MLSAAERQALLAHARSSVAAALAGRTPPAPPAGGPAFAAPAAVFVTLHTTGGELRGCLGTFTARRPLPAAVAEYAVAAATRDSRFPAVTARELAELRLKVSVLSPLVPVRDPAEVEVGRHGIYILGRGRWEGYAGCYLPEVATEFGMGREEFLTHCSARKAGLPPDAWKDPAQAEVRVFTTESFGEEPTADEPAPDAAPGRSRP